MLQLNQTLALIFLFILLIIAGCDKGKTCDFISKKNNMVGDWIVLEEYEVLDADSIIGGGMLHFKLSLFSNGKGLINKEFTMEDVDWYYQPEPEAINLINNEIILGNLKKVASFIIKVNDVNKQIWFRTDTLQNERREITWTLNRME